MPSSRDQPELPARDHCIVVRVRHQLDRNQRRLPLQVRHRPSPEALRRDLQLAPDRLPACSVLSTYAGPLRDPNAQLLRVAPPAAPLDARQFSTKIYELSVHRRERNRACASCQDGSGRNLTPQVLAPAEDRRSSQRGPSIGGHPFSEKSRRPTLASGPSKPRQRPTLPQGCPYSTIGPEKLNFRVRDGNGCDLFGIAARKKKTKCEARLAVPPVGGGQRWIRHTLC